MGGDVVADVGQAHRGLNLCSVRMGPSFGGPTRSFRDPLEARDPPFRIDGGARLRETRTGRWRRGLLGRPAWRPGPCVLTKSPRNGPRESSRAHGLQAGRAASGGCRAGPGRGLPCRVQGGENGRSAKAPSSSQSAPRWRGMARRGRRDSSRRDGISALPPYAVGPERVGMAEGREHEQSVEELARRRVFRCKRGVLKPNRACQASACARLRARWKVPCRFPWRAKA